MITFDFGPVIIHTDMPTLVALAFTLALVAGITALWVLGGRATPRATPDETPAPSPPTQEPLPGLASRCLACERRGQQGYGVLECRECHGLFCLAHVHLSTPDEPGPEGHDVYCYACAGREIRRMLGEIARNLPGFLVWRLPVFLARRALQYAQVYRFNGVAVVIGRLDWVAVVLEGASRRLVTANNRLIGWNLSHGPRGIVDVWERMYIAAAHQDGKTATVTRSRRLPDGRFIGYAEVYPPHGPCWREPAPGVIFVGGLCADLMTASTQELAALPADFTGDGPPYGDEDEWGQDEDQDEDELEELPHVPRQSATY
jgi:hypothetical protein